MHNLSHQLSRESRLSASPAKLIDLDRVAAHQDAAGLANRFRVAGTDWRHLPASYPGSVGFEQFRRHVDENVPVLLADACPDMPALTLWRHDDYLVDRVGHARLLVRTAPSESATFGDAARLQAGGQQLYEFAEVAAADLLQDLTSSAQPSLYGARIELQEDLPELVPDIMSHYELPWRYAFGRPYRGGVITYIGAGGQSTPLHFDDYENLVLVVRGSKEFTLFPPSESAHLYPVPHALGTMYSQVPRAELSACKITGDTEFERTTEGPTCQPDDAEESAGAAAASSAARSGSLGSSGAEQAAAAAPEQDELARFPSVQQARGFRCTVRSGQMLYVPVGWWHSVRGSPEMNLTLNYWFAQSPQKGDTALYRRSLEQSSKKWLRQLESMGLRRAS